MNKWIIKLDMGWLATRVHDTSSRIERTSNPADSWVFNEEHVAREHAAWIRACRNEKAAAWLLERALRETGKVPDPIHEPDHYQARDGSTIECMDAIRAMLTPEEFRGFLRGNALKYQWRYRDKGGGDDLAKAEVYLTLLKAHEERNR